MTNNLLSCIELEPASPATSSIIWMHGLGANGHDFESIVPELGLPPKHGIRFVFPNAPVIPVTINGGYKMPAWYDILNRTEDDHQINEAQLMASVAAVGKLIDREIERGVDSRRIAIAGFSQGGAVGYQVALAYPKPLAGLLALSTYFAADKRLIASEANRSIPICIYHGSVDPVIPECFAQESRDALVKLGYKPTYKSYPMPHSVCMEEITDIANWIKITLV